MSKVFLREKKLKHGKLGLYLDFYPPINNPKTQKQTRREHLKLHIFARPKNEIEREHNKETKMLGEHIRARRQLEIQAKDYGFLLSNENGDFIAFFQQVVDSKLRRSKSTHYTWKSALDHFKTFSNDNCKFRDVTANYCQRYKNFLLDNTRFAANTKATYFTKFLSVCRMASEQNLFRENPAKDIKPISEVEVQKEFLTLEELQKLAATPFRFDDLRRAALFAALTGLRRSDIFKLVWQEVQHSDQQGYFIRFKMQKTSSEETLNISDEAFELLGTRGEPGERVFKRLNRSHTVYLQIWAALAGIDKHLTFHTFRHTYATLQLTFGTDIYTVCKMLGHKDVKTTQIYAKIIDKTKREAANKIKLK